MLIEAIVGSLRAIVDRMTVVRITKLVLCFGLGFGLRAESACGQTANPPVADPLLEAALKRLAPIPVFTIINPAGLPVLDTVPNPKDKTKTIEVTTFFTGHQDAETLLTLLKTKNPAVGNVSRIAAISLRGPYEINMKQKDKAHVVGFRVVASQQQQEAGLAVLKQNGVQAKVFPWCAPVLCDRRQRQRPAHGQPGKQPDHSVLLQQTGSSQHYGCGQTTRSACLRRDHDRSDFAGSTLPEVAEREEIRSGENRSRAGSHGGAGRREHAESSAKYAPIRSSLSAPASLISVSCLSPAPDSLLEAALKRLVHAL